MSNKPVVPPSTEVKVPRDPEAEARDALKNAPPINLESDKYRDFGKLHHTQSTDEVVTKMISKQESARGQKIDQTAPQKATVNLGGIKDDRADRKFFKLHTKG